MNRMRLILLIMIAGFSTVQSTAQTLDRNEVLRTFKKGKNEAKRSVLANIRNSNNPVDAELALVAFKDGSAVVRATAAGSVGSLPPSTAVPALSGLLDDNSSLVRKEAAVALGMTGHESASDPLRQRLKKEKNSEVRAGLIEALGRTASTETIELLLGLLTVKVTDENEFQMAMAARGIGQISRRARGAQPARTIPMETLATTPIPVLPVAEGVLKGEDGRAATALEAILLSTDTPANLKREIVFALGEVGGRKHLRIFEGYLNDEDPYLSGAARGAIESYHSRISKQ